jgi:uridine kinase
MRLLRDVTGFAVIVDNDLRSRRSLRVVKRDVNRLETSLEQLIRQQQAVTPLQIGFIGSTALPWYLSERHMVLVLRLAGIVRHPD